MNSAKKDCKKALELLDTELQNIPLLWPHPASAEDMQQDKVRQMLTSHERAKVTMHKAFLEYAKGRLMRNL